MSQSIGTRGQLAFLSLPAVIFTTAMIAFPFAYTVWFSLHEFSFGGKPKLNFGMNYVEMAGDGEAVQQLMQMVIAYRSGQSQ